MNVDSHQYKEGYVRGDTIGCTLNWINTCTLEMGDLCVFFVFCAGFCEEHRQKACK